MERVRDLALWEVVCANWLAEGHKFSQSDNVLDRYCAMEARQQAEEPAASGAGMSKLERESWALSGLSDQEKAQHCVSIQQFLVEDRRNYVEDLRRRAASGSGAGAPS